MIATGKCPHCKKTVRNVKVEDIDIKPDFQTKWRGFSYVCPSCKCVLGVEMNPFTLNSDLVRELTGK